MSAGALRLLIADDHAPLRGVLRSVLDEGDITVVGEAADGREALQMAALLQPDIVLLDINMPNMNGLEAARWLKLQQPHIAVVGLSAADTVFAETAMRAAGAAGFVAKGARAPELRLAIFDAWQAHQANACPASSASPGTA